MRHVEFIPFRLTDIVDIFSIQIDGKDKTELQEFIITFKNSQNINFQKDFEQVVNSLVGRGGGLKITQTYEEDETLLKHVQTLQNIDYELSKIENEGKDLHKEIYNLTIQIN